jgi:hypothetical protein
VSKSPMTMIAKTGVGDIAARRRLEFAQGSGITISVLDLPLTKAVKVSISATGGGIPSGRSAVVAATGLSVPSGMELHRPAQGGLLLRLKRRLTFPLTRAVALASPEYGWSWLNRAALSSADENTTTASAFFMAHGATSTDWSTSTKTAPFRYKDLDRVPGEHYQVLARLACNGDANYEQVHLMIYSAVTGAYVRIGPGYANGIKIVSNAGSGTTVGITQAQRDQGVWVRILVTGDGDVVTQYSLANQATPPSSWTTLATYTVFQATYSWSVGLLAMTVNTAGNFEAECLYYDDDLMRSSPPATAAPLWPATQFDATVPVTQLLADYDMGSDAPTPHITRIRQLLADAENTLRGDAATWEWALVLSAAPGAAASGWAAAGAVAVVGSGRYWNLWARPTSTGEEGGSLLVPRLVLPAA